MLCWHKIPLFYFIKWKTNVLKQQSVVAIQKRMLFFHTYFQKNISRILCSSWECGFSKRWPLQPAKFCMTNKCTHEFSVTNSIGNFPISTKGKVWVRTWNNMERTEGTKLSLPSQIWFWILYSTISIYTVFSLNTSVSSFISCRYVWSPASW